MAILKEAWHYFTQQWQAWLVIGLVSALVQFALAITCVGIVCIPALIAGQYLVAFKQLRGQNPEIGDLFGGFHWFGATTVTFLIAALGILVGYCLCILPGIVLAIWWLFAIPLCVTHNVSGMDALRMSKDKVAQNFWDVVILMLVMFVVQVVCGMIPLAQILVGVPLQMLMLAIAHRDLFGLEGALPPVRDAAPAMGPAAAAVPGVACPRCRAVNARGVRFCTSCGQAIS
jgi:uncharacterized membrane protein